MQQVLDKIHKGLIVSCQALENEPLHSSFIMGRMAIAAKEGGATCIRANSVADIMEIKKNVDLPVIGIIKQVYGQNDVYITPTMAEIDALMETKAEIIATDATARVRPDGKTLKQFYSEIRAKYPDVLLMADVSTIEEAVYADDLGFDIVAPTLYGYTNETFGQKIYQDDYAVLKEIVKEVKKAKVIAEGNVITPEIARSVLNMNVHAVVVGGAITRPQQITKRFVDAIQK
ncbi:N-acetylmannosamine-6-phosphate 2-epimerase [Peribacillus simplex]|uniref:Putative N-acetylmannosamine-6-phosphate 2-epimerase n=1 Tax=Peribacillus simplex NBRC 15720 = DSM 1321 TaxID=1349754 RepID=A0A223EJM3_9BACI|nr:N-acetylmannosamine-6-phosphate 2-epimerase [Peribacillus simplex]ASS95436.1 N-acetylmannosamine-6-phosphate 2-epimerase [Peribacillus simplex NBRC 15720 = DSM 1321]MEC1397999.1 N-acetylmannosamine-6-phosphate 2-epimerase [Peribacillus simplex]MED3909523.1 N-acetylmannosamine-6-phosphate 2-epimerase [Peribacillus simplex]MED3985026.1 N-acetylmannosamine-6-phosphate 2-epimerase [Peribacillus simplex]MED4096276.1 N-acetylmannosamine-6-phosphate 2-epimerase [Peribacillus simplex]